MRIYILQAGHRRTLSESFVLEGNENGYVHVSGNNSEEHLEGK